MLVNLKMPLAKTLSLTFLTLSTLCAQSQLTIDPPNWWGDLEQGRVEVLVSGDGLAAVSKVACPEHGEIVVGWRSGSLPGHVWVELNVSGLTSSQDVVLTFTTGPGEVHEVPFHVEPELDRGNRLDQWGVVPAMYLLLPDRFSNGNPNNDDVDSAKERGVDRAEMYARHGGDLQGVTDRLGYLEDLGIGAIWMTPVVENDLAKTSYHGYACTDSYKVDPRLGTLNDYKDLVREAHLRGIRVVHDGCPTIGAANTDSSPTLLTALGCTIGREALTKRSAPTTAAAW